MEILDSLNADLSHALVAEFTVFDVVRAKLTACASEWLMDGVREFV
ncbi:hypothetical protein ABT124_05245 [Streptomyces sp. NPDC001982]